MRFLLAGDTELTDGVVVFELPGDFNEDGQVDGTDFLAWQRGESPNPGSADDLADWQANYGLSALDALTGSVKSVPEPTTLTLITLLSLMAISRRKPRATTV